MKLTSFVSGNLISIVADSYPYDDVFVFEDMVYAMECKLCVVQVYRNRNNSLTKLHDIKYSCKCNNTLYHHTILVTNKHIIQCCPPSNLVSILDRSGELLRKIPIADILVPWPLLRQIDVDKNFLIADHWSNRLLIAHVDQPSSQWRVVNLPDLPDGAGCFGAVWFRHRLYVTRRDGHFMTFTPEDAPSS